MNFKAILTIGFLFMLICCKKETPQSATILIVDGNFEKHYPEKINNFAFKKFDIFEAFKIDKLIIFVGNKHLVCLNENQKIVFESKSMEDIFQYRPNFYISKDKKQVIILGAMAFEYNVGMEIFSIENNKIKQLGTLDLETNNEAVSIAEVTKITKKNKQIEFSFDADSLVLSPGGEDKVIANKIKYIYKNNKLSLISDSSIVVIPSTQKADKPKTNEELQAEVEKIFDASIGKKLKNVAQELDTRETHIADLTGDGLNDAVIWYVAFPEGSPFSPVTNRLALFINENNVLKQYADFEPAYMFTVKSLNNNIINITKYDFAEGDDPRNPSIEIPVTLKLNGKNEFVEIK